MKKELLSFKVNGQAQDLMIEPNRTLLSVLRDDLGLKGAKHGCGAGECGSCTVLMNGQPVNSCLVLGIEAQGSAIETIEGLADGNSLHPLQEAFVEKGAIQCGFCTPGMILASKALLERKKRPSEEEIRQALSGNLCRCTGYQKIVEAVSLAAGRMAKKGRSKK